MRDKLWILGTLCLSITSIVGVQIREMRVPAVVESGTQPHVILDCDYDLSENEGRQVDVKWFFRDDPQPFFQWLPGRPPQTIGELFKHRLDLKYEVPGSDLYRRHRAIKIMRPTTELSGTYRCKVSSFVDEDFMQKKMTVYSPATGIKLIYTKPDSRTLNLSCIATGVYPKPEVQLSWGTTDDHSETTTLMIEREGLYDVSVHKMLSESELKPETIFECMLTIPGTTYVAREETMYFPGIVMYQITAGAKHLGGFKLDIFYYILILFIAYKFLLIRT